MTKLASAAQAWRINQAGRLQITDEPVEPILFEDAWELIATLQADRAEAATGKGAAGQVDESDVVEDAAP